MGTECKLDEFRGVLVATVYDIDWPKTKDNEQAQKKEFIDLLDNLQSLNFNIVIVQIRAKSDAFYNSKINPWSSYLTGTQGKNPGYDPLKFMIEETHKRDMQFYGWLNPYRITTKGIDLNVLADNNPAKLNPSWVLEYNNSLSYNPENKEVVKYLATTVFEIVSNYDVDGIVFDEYFYPESYPLPDCNYIWICGCWEYVDIGDYRRSAINYLIKTVYKVIKAVNPKVQFGVSPFAVWKNKSSDITGSNTDAKEGYYEFYSDPLTWMEQGIIDFIAPQVYWSTNAKKYPYETLVKWWANIVEGSNVNLYIAQNISSEPVAKELEKEININREYPEVKGNILFSYSSIAKNYEGVYQQLQKSYSEKACI